jgi:DNA-binding HxlR family transcriptional regulator
VHGQPGITIPELAAKMGIVTTYLYRVLPALEKEGKVRRRVWDGTPRRVD